MIFILNIKQKFKFEIFIEGDYFKIYYPSKIISNDISDYISFK